MKKYFKKFSKNLSICIGLILIFALACFVFNTEIKRQDVFAEENIEGSVVVSLDDGFSSSLFGVENVTIGETFAFSIPNRSNYTFVGWKYGDVYLTNSLGVGNGVWTIDFNVTLVAGWDPDDKTIQFDTGINNLAVNSIEIEYGSQITLPHDFSVNGRSFNGWYDGVGGTGTQYAGADGVMTRVWDKETPTATLYAKWSLTQYSITYDLGQGTNSSNNPTQYNIESPTITLEVPTRSGYRFMRWYNSNGTTVTTIPTGSYGNITLTAEWEYEYTITVNANSLVCNNVTYNGTLNTVKAIEGELITLFDTGVGGFILKLGSAYYEQGSSFAITKDEDFQLVEKNRNQLYDSSTGYYEIWTYNQLNTIVRTYLSSNYRLMANITQPENTIWIPMGTFTGIFNGNDYSIRNLNIVYGLEGSTQEISEKQFGLFKVNSGTISNLNISEGKILFYDYTATYSEGAMSCGFIAAINNGTISGCESIGSFSQFSNISTIIESRIGAICGENNGRVENCEVFETSIKLTVGRGGGIAGYNNGGTITDCEVSLSRISCYQGFTSDTGDGYATGHYAMIGGIVGHTSGGTISNCTVGSGVDICYNGYSSESRTLAPEIGIVAGRSENNANITGNTAEGEIDDGDYLQVITWTTGILWWQETHTWNQAQYLGGTVGRYV